MKTKEQKYREAVERAIAHNNRVAVAKEFIHRHLHSVPAIKRYLNIRDNDDTYNEIIVANFLLQES